MGNSTNKITEAVDAAEDLSTFLARVAYDGTLSDVLTSVKSDQGTVKIDHIQKGRFSAAQLNLLEDLVVDYVTRVGALSTIDRVADTVQELKALGTNDGVSVGDLARISTTGNVWKCTAVDGGGATSTWVPGDGEYNVLDYGAVGGGDATVNQAAFAAALADGRNVYAPYHASGYALDDGITVDGARLWTEGWTRLLFTLPDDNTDGVTLAWSGLYTDGMSILDGFQITGSGSSDTGVQATDSAAAAGRDLVRVNGGERCALKNLRLRHGKRDNIHIEGSTSSEWTENPLFENVRSYYAWRDCCHIAISNNAHFINELLATGLECRVGGRSELYFSMAGGGSSKLEGATFIACNFDVGNRSNLSATAKAAYSRQTAGSVYIDAGGGSSSLARVAWINCTWEDTVGYATNGVEDPIGFSATGIVSSMSIQDCSVPTGFNPANSNRYSRAGHPTYDSGYVTHYYERGVSRLYATGDFITGQLRLGTGGTPDASSLLHLIASGTACQMKLETPEGGGYTVRANDGTSNPAWRHNVNSGETVLFAVAGTKVLEVKSGVIDIAGNINHDGTQIGFNSAAPVAQGSAIADSAVDLTELTGKFNTLLAYLRSRGDIAT